MVEQKTIEEIISDHETRNASLREVFVEKNVDLKEPRTIECHFWTWSRNDAAELSESLKSRGFEILTQRPAAIAGDPSRWKLEAAVKQSIDLTMRREFIDELARWQIPMVGSMTVEVQVASHRLGASSMVPFRYVESYEVPRAIALRYRDRLLLLQSACDEKLDEYPTTIPCTYCPSS